jgi:hypothetical protein
MEDAANAPPGNVWANNRPDHFGSKALPAATVLILMKSRRYGMAQYPKEGCGARAMLCA